jgi:hypothetical protein
MQNVVNVKEQVWSCLLPLLPKSLENDAFLLLGLARGAGAEHGSVVLHVSNLFNPFRTLDLGSGAPDGFVKDALEVALSEGRALHVLDRLDLLGNANGLFVLDGCHLLLSQTLLGALVVAEIELGSDQDDGDAGCMVINLGVPLQRLISTCPLSTLEEMPTFALTLSNEGGLTMEKQMRKTSV